MSDSEKEPDELQSDVDEDPNTFHIGERLDPPHARLYSTEELHTLIHEGIIDLNPPYQRDVVWTEPKQTKLLDSIYRNFYVPPVVFAIYKDEEGEEVSRCVDGKQRLTSIQKFFDGQIPYRDPVTKKAFYYTCAESHKPSRLEVPQYMKDDFKSKQITCVEYRNLPRGFERDIFQRVQLGMPLTAAEKLQAISSPWTDWIGELDARSISCDDGLTTKINIDMKRGRDFQCLAQLVYCCHSYPNHVIPAAAKMEQWISSGDVVPQTFKTQMENVLSAFWHVASKKELNDAFVRIPQRVAPAEFVFIGVILYAMRSCSWEARAEQIYKMRKHVRHYFPDVRMRNDIIKLLWTFVDGITELVDNQPSSSRGKGPANGKKRRARGRRDDSDVEMSDDHSNKRGAQTAKRSKGKHVR